MAEKPDPAKVAGAELDESRPELPPVRRPRAPEPELDPYLRWVKPQLGPRLRASGLLLDYHRGAGDYLYTRDAQGREVEVLDLVGGYGANLLGHNHPEIQEAARSVLDEGVPFLAQGSRRDDAARLAATLGEAIRSECHREYVFVFTHSGTEAVNLALMHAHLEYRRRAGFPGEAPAILVLESGFHGVYTQAVTKRDFPGPDLLRVSPNDPAQLEEVFDHERRPHGSRLMGMVVETIQGEGGVRLIDPEFLALARKLCRRDSVPLIVDEVQTGMGRTGRLLDSFHTGVYGDYVVLAKALSGSLTKLGLTLVDRERWVSDFDVYSLSTYAEDPLSARVGRQAVEVLTRDNGAVVRQVARRGEEFLAVLDAVREEYPKALRDVRGRGLMIGCELARQAENPSNALRMVSESGLLGQFVASYLLRREGLRVAPTLSANRVLRMQPSYEFPRAEMDRVADALRTMCDALEKGDCGFLARPLVREMTEDEKRVRPVRYKPRPERQPLPPGIPKVAFLGHFIEADHLSLWDPSFGSFTAEEKGVFLDRFAALLEPKVFRQMVVTSKTGQQIGYLFIGLAQTSTMYAESWRTRDLGWIRDKIDRALDLAREEGCHVVGFGGFTSIVTDNLRSVDAPDLALTTGNSYTVSAGVDALLGGAAQAGIHPGGATLGVVGALGNIASIYTLIMTPRVEKVVLVGRPRTHRRLKRFRDERVPAEFRDRIVVAEDVAALKECDLVLAASNHPHALIDPEHLASDKPVVICDISIPPDCSPAVEQMPNVEVVQGGLIRPWENHEVSFPGVPLAEGRMYACMAETALMGLEGLREDFSRGAVTVENVERVRGMAERHGFEYLGPKRERSL